MRGGGEAGSAARRTRCIMPERRDDFKVSSTERQIVKALGSIGSATALSRVAGFVRDVVVALAFGAGPVTDAFFVAFRIPNVLRRLLAEGALATAMIPVFSEYFVTRSWPEVLRMLRAVLALALVALGVTALLGIATAPWILKAIAPGFADDPAQAGLAVLLTRVMFPYVVLVGLAALATGALNAQGRFFASALGPAVQNVAMIAAIPLLASRVDPPILSLAIGVLVGGVGQVVIQLPSLRRCGLLVLPAAEFRHPALARLVRLLLPAVFGLAAVQVMVFVNTLLASLLRPGSISYLYYADRVMEFPLGVFGIALATAALPSMSAQAARGDHAALRDTVSFSLRLSVFIAVPAAVGLVVLGHPIVRLLFQRGEFTASDAVLTTQALAGYAVGLPAFSATRLAAQTFYALGDTRTPVWAGLVSVAANIALALLLMWPLKHAGLALASSLSAYINLALLYWLLRRRLGRLGSRETLRSLARTAAASSALLLWCLWAGPRLGAGWPGAAWMGGALIVGVVVYGAVAAVLRAPEIPALRQMLRRRGHSLPAPGDG